MQWSADLADLLPAVRYPFSWTTAVEIIDAGLRVLRQATNAPFCLISDAARFTRPDRANHMQYKAMILLSRTAPELGKLCTFSRLTWLFLGKKAVISYIMLFSTQLMDCNLFIRWFWKLASSAWMVMAFYPCQPTYERVWIEEAVPAQKDSARPFKIWVTQISSIISGPKS